MREQEEILKAIEALRERAKVNVAELGLLNRTPEDDAENRRQLAHCVEQIEALTKRLKTVSSQASGDLPMELLGGRSSDQPAEDSAA